MNEFEVFSFFIIFGKFGKGKTTLNTILALNEMYNSYYIENCLVAIEDLEQHFCRTFNRPLQQHTVYADYEISDGHLRNYGYDFDNFSLPTDDRNFELLVPYACVHVEEAHSGILLSYDWNEFPKETLLACSRVRHPHYRFVLDVQNLIHINKSVRQFTYEYITPLDIDSELDCLNNIRKVTITCGVFKDYNKALEYEVSQNIDLVEEIREYSYDGNVWNCFDSYDKKYDFFDVPPDKDFVFEHSKIDKSKKEEKGEGINIW